MSSTQIPARKLDGSSGDKKHNAPTNPTATSVQPRALAQTAENSFGKSAPEKSPPEKDNQKRRELKPGLSQKKAMHGDMADPSPKKIPDIDTLLKRCFAAASATKASETENTNAINRTLANIYRLYKR